MNKDDIGDKLQRGYHATIDTIESLVKKEGKSLKEALKLQNIGWENGKT